MKKITLTFLLVLSAILSAQAQAQTTLVALEPKDFDSNMMVYPTWFKDASGGYYAYVASNDKILMYDFKGSPSKVAMETTKEAHQKNISQRGLSSNKNGVLVSVADDNAIKIWSSTLTLIATIQEKPTKLAAETGMGAAAVANNATLVAYAFYGKDDVTVIKIKDYLLKKDIITLKGHGKELIKKVVFSDNGKYIISASDGELIVWEIATGKALDKYAGKNLAAPIFTPDNKSYIVQNDKNLFKRSINGKELSTFGSSFEDKAFVSYTISNDGKFLYGANAEIFIKWNAQTGAEMKKITYKGMSYITYSIVATDGKTALSVGTAKMHLVKLDW